MNANNDEPNLLYTYIDGDITLKVQKVGNRLQVVFDLDGETGNGQIVLDEYDYGLYVTCPQVHENPVALLDLYYQSPEAEEEMPDGERPPLRVELFSPGNWDDPIGAARCFPKETRVTLETWVQNLRTGELIRDNDVFGVVPKRPPSASKIMRRQKNKRQ